MLSDLRSRFLFLWNGHRSRFGRGCLGMSVVVFLLNKIDTDPLGRG